MPSPFMAASEGTLEEFTEAYDPSVDDVTDLLIPALTNKDPEARVAIASRLLDDGADATVLQSHNSTINVLLGQRNHDVELEAPLLTRLIDGGADVNHESRVGDAPIIQLLQHPSMRDEAMVPFYEVLLGSSDIDLDAPANASGASVRERIFASGGYVRANLRAMLDRG